MNIVELFEQRLDSEVVTVKLLKQSILEVINMIEQEKLPDRQVAELIKANTSLKEELIQLDNTIKLQRNEIRTLSSALQKTQQTHKQQLMHAKDEIAKLMHTNQQLEYALEQAKKES